VSGELPLTSFFARKYSDKATRKRKADASGSQLLDTPTVPGSSNGSSRTKSAVKRQKPIESEEPSTSQTFNLSQVSSSSSGSHTKKARKSMRHASPTEAARKQNTIIDLTEVSPHRPQRSVAFKSSPSQTPVPRTPVGAVTPLPPSSIPPPTSSTRYSSPSPGPPTSPVLTPLTRGPSRPRFKRPALPLDHGTKGTFDRDEIVSSSQTQILTMSPTRLATSQRDSAFIFADDEDEDVVIPSSQTQLLIRSPQKLKHKRNLRSKSSEPLSQMECVPSSQTEYDDDVFLPKKSSSDSYENSCRGSSFVPSSQPTLDGVHCLRWESRDDAPERNGSTEDHDACDGQQLTQGPLVNSPSSYENRQGSYFDWSHTQDPRDSLDSVLDDNLPLPSAGLHEDQPLEEINLPSTLSPLDGIQHSDKLAAEPPVSLDRLSADPHSPSPLIQRKMSLSPKEITTAQSEPTANPPPQRFTPGLGKSIPPEEDSETESESDGGFPHPPPRVSPRPTATPIARSTQGADSGFTSASPNRDHSALVLDTVGLTQGSDPESEIDWERGEDSFVFGSSFVDFSCYSLPDVAKEFRDMFD
jgi:hypothetical protein